MDLKELRIGNYVNYYLEPPISENELVKLTLYDFINIDFGWRNYNPIRLTEEWLIKFGFELVHKGNKHYQIQNPKGYKDSHKIHIFKTIGDNWHLAFSDTINGDYTPACHFKYVHQLQNLYFALTGKELTIKN